MGKIAIGLVICVPLLIVIGAVVFADIQFDIGIGGHMKRAADANTI